MPGPFDEVPAQVPFELDPFQVEACAAIDAGRSVLVSAPTGAGKTVIAEHAVAAALDEGGRAFYTTPVKALSNQKFRDLGRRFGDEMVGLLTGDSVVRADASIVVMTTEVLRNMLYAHADNLRGLSMVVLDEVHYLQDPYRGAVWEEVLIQAPPQVRFVSLSATVTNVDELARWLGEVRGPTDVVVATQRPVELRHRYLVGRPGDHRLRELSILRDGRPNPEGDTYDSRLVSRGRTPQDRRPTSRRWRQPDPVSVAEHLRSTGRLPAIHFIFSRAGCDAAAGALHDAGIELTTADDRARIDQITARHLAVLTPEDHATLDATRFVSMLRAGVAPHHAGLIPPFKVAVEECFAAGLLRVVYATETLALGINMPARSVVVDTLSRFRGDGHQFLTPGEFTQLSGRAGRRGLDDVGDVVVLWSPYVAFAHVAELVASDEFHLTSAFRPTYNMVANLVQGQSPGEARSLLERSFGQFQHGSQLQLLRQRRRDIRQRLKTLRNARASRRDPSAIRALREQLEELEIDISGAEESIADRFGRMLSVLEHLGFFRGWEVTTSGRILAKIFHEHDALIAGAIDEGIFDGLSPVQLAALASSFTYQHRSRDDPGPPFFPDPELRRRYGLLEDRDAELADAEHDAFLEEGRPLEAGFIAHAHAWASGHGLAEVLADELVSGGDFVRNIRQVADLCGQIARATPDADTRACAYAALAALNRDLIIAGDPGGGEDDRTSDPGSRDIRDADEVVR